MNEYQTTTLWFGAFRYYLGRMTYEVSNFCNLFGLRYPNIHET